MENKSKYIEVIEKYAIILLAYTYKAIRYILRMVYKILRLFFRSLKNGVVFIGNKIEPYYHRVQDKLYAKACKTFDLK